MPHNSIYLIIPMVETPLPKLLQTLKAQVEHTADERASEEREDTLDLGIQTPINFSWDNSKY